MPKKKTNMYRDSIKQWNVIIGCNFDCVYCKKSFQAQMKRQKNRCMDCYEYIPHFHENRLENKLPRTKGDEFIWCCSSSDIYFARPDWVVSILSKIETYPKRTFFFQSKQPSVFNDYKFPENVILGITLESNRDYSWISKAPPCRYRASDFAEVKHPRKFVTIEPIMQFDLYPFTLMIKDIMPERVYLGYDTKKSDLLEPRLVQTNALVKQLRKFTTVKLKYIPEKK